MRDRARDGDVAPGWLAPRAEGKTTIEEVVRVTQTDEVMAETELQSAPAMLGEGPVVFG